MTEPLKRLRDLWAIFEDVILQYVPVYTTMYHSVGLMIGSLK